MKTSFKAASAALAMAVVFLFAANAFGQDVINTILKRMDDHNKALTSLKASVEMVKENAQLGGVVDSTVGTVLYLPKRKANPFVRIDWKSPEESLAVVDKNYVLYRPRLGQAYTGLVEKAKGNPRAGNALAFMNMTRAELKENYDVVYLGQATVKGGVETWHLRMTPKTASTYKYADVWVDGNGMPVQTKIVEANSDSTTVHLSNLQKNVRIDASAFKITLPRGTKIVKG